MAIQFVAINYRSPRRLRLFFSEAVGAGAFSASHYVVESTDALGVSPPVDEALLVSDSPHVVELALGEDLVDRGRYVATCTGVPSAVSGTVTASLTFETPGKVQAPSASFSTFDIGAVLYGNDLVWDGKDIAEDPNGDLALVSGPPNAEEAIKRAVLSNGLPWGAEYGGHIREFVDAPEPTIGEMVGRLQRTVEKDDRVKHAAVKVLPGSGGGIARIDIRGVLIGDNPFNVKTDVPRSG